jgi:hypothetical protein
MLAFCWRQVLYKKKLGLAAQRRKNKYLLRFFEVAGGND